MNELQLSNLIFQGRGPYSFQINPGHVAGLQGASGAGKTLLLRAIADLDPNQGQVRLGDIICSRVPAPQWRKTVAMLPAESFWWFDMVGDHFQVSSRRVNENLQQLGFEPDVLNWEVSRLSTGEKQRLAIVRLLQNRPRALLLDEPTASLDAANIDRTETMLVEYCRQEQVPLLWVSHDPGQLERVADMEFFLENGGTLKVIRGEQHGR
jgi:ABC-type iron transport system FetAB ATPase subunit